MTNKEKILKLHNFLLEKNRFNHYNYSNLVWKDDELYIASWDTNYHNGNREDYTERLATESDYSVYLLVKLESDYINYVEELELIEARNQRMYNFYNDPF